MRNLQEYLLSNLFTVVKISGNIVHQHNNKKVNCNILTNRNTKKIGNKLVELGRMTWINFKNEI